MKPMKLLAVALLTHPFTIHHSLSPRIIIFLLCFIPFMAQASVCSSGWKITGYYSPVESDFSQVIDASVLVKNLGVRQFNQDFVADVKLNGWGRTRFGWYLGYFGQQWHKSPTPLDAQGKHLQLGAVAIDRDVLKMGNKITIPQVNDIVGVAQFVARDTGSAIKKKHIDVYTGEGKLARKVSWQVTGQQQVCITAI
jgi:3D (Asp-Asp-Asp) domain-containing protein